MCTEFKHIFMYLRRDLRRDIRRDGARHPLDTADRGAAEEDKRGEPEDEGGAGDDPPDARRGGAAQGDHHQGRPLQGKRHLPRQQGEREKRFTRSIFFRTATKWTHFIFSGVDHHLHLRLVRSSNQLGMMVLLGYE